jgi:hypothetical protein
LCGVRLKSGFFAKETRSGLAEMTGMDRRNIYSHFRQVQISLPCKLEAWPKGYVFVKAIHRRAKNINLLNKIGMA